MLSVCSMELVVLILFNMVISHISPMSEAVLSCRCNTTQCVLQGNINCSTQTGVCAVVKESSTVELKCLESQEHCVSTTTRVTKCCHTSYCNTDLLDTDDTPTVDSTDVRTVVIILACIVIGFCLLIVLVILSLVALCHFKRYWKKRSSGSRAQVGVEGLAERALQPRNHVEAIVPKGQCISDLIQQATRHPNTGQLSLLMQKNIVRSTETYKHLHSGRFSEVYLGKWREETVVVKLYASDHQDEWYKEVGIYQMPHLHHEHVLQFIAADHKQGPRGLDCWLVTIYHSLGSLREYLVENSLEVDTCVRMCWSVASGLAFLHDFRSAHPQDKPCIVHRNLTSTNVLLKSNGECCLADMNSCVSLSAPSSEMTSRLKIHKQDIHYRPPEFLAPTDVSDEGFHAHMRGDVYSLGLVLWETCCRCSIGGQFYEALLPYQEELPLTCSLEEANQLIFVEENRPEIPLTWREHKVMKPLSAIITDCWSNNSLSRPQALSVKDGISDFLINNSTSSILPRKSDKMDKFNQTEDLNKDNSSLKVLT